MKRDIFYFLTAFLVSGLLVGGVIWGLKKTGKIQVNTESEIKTMDIDEFVRLLVPDKGKSVKREDIYAKLGKLIEWDSLSLHTNFGRGKYTVSLGGRVPMILKEKLEPLKWDVYIIGDGDEYHGFCLSVYRNENMAVQLTNRDFTVDDFIKPLLEPKRGDYFNEDEMMIQFNGKIPTWMKLGEGIKIAEYTSDTNEEIIMELEELFQERITGHFMYYFDSGKSEFLTCQSLVSSTAPLPQNDKCIN